MTETLERRSLPHPGRPVRTPGPRVLGPGAVAAAWALGAGLVALALPVLLAWATDARSGAGAAEATRTAGQLWLLAHGTSLAIPGGVVGLTPLGLVLLPLALLHRAGRHGARTAGVTNLRLAPALVVAIAFPYAAAAGFLAAVFATEAVQPDPVGALVGGFAVAVVGAGTGVVREAVLAGAVLPLPGAVRRMLVGAAAAVAVLLAVGSVLAGLSLAVHGSRATALAGATDPGLVGGLTLFLLGLLLVPNAAVWGAAFAAGPGFAVGVGTAVGPFATTLGPAPALPLLAALPSGDVPPWLGLVVLAGPVLAGLVAGALVGRRLAGATAPRAALEGALIGPAAGAAFAVLAWQSGGSLGGSRLTDVGPSPWQVGLAVAVEIALPAAAAAALAVRRRG